MPDDRNDFEERSRIYYSSMLNAWLSTRMELDKSLLSLSTFAIGLLVTLVTTVGVSSCAGKGVLLISALSFCVCLFSVLEVFSLNASIVQEELKKADNSNSQTKAKLTKLDERASFSFKVGVFLLIVLAAIIVNEKEGTKMSDNNYQPVDQPQEVPVRKSWDNIGEMKPQQPVETPQKPIKKDD